MTSRKCFVVGSLKLNYANYNLLQVGVFFKCNAVHVLVEYGINLAMWGTFDACHQLETIRETNSSQTQFRNASNYLENCNTWGLKFVKI